MANNFILSTAELPSSLHSIAHFIKIANDFAGRDPIIQYWCMMKAMEDAMMIGMRTPEERKYGGMIIGVMEKVKEAHKDVDGTRNRVVGHVHIENYAMKLFNYAEQNDAQSNFDEKMMRAFYTSGYLFDLLTSKTLLDDGEEPNEILLNNKKYAQWRASYIFNCFRKNETPVSASANRQQEQTNSSSEPSFNKDADDELKRLESKWDLPKVPSGTSQQPSQYGFNEFNVNSAINSTGDVSISRNSTLPFSPAKPQNFGDTENDVRAPFQSPPVAPAIVRQTGPGSSTISTTGQMTTNERAAAYGAAKDLTLEDYAEARKYTKFALSAMDFEDAGTAIQNFQRAMAVLQRRQVSPQPHK